MKIETRRDCLYTTASSDLRRQSFSPSAGLRESRNNYDGLTIQAAKSVSPEQSFKDALVSKIISETKVPASPQKLENLDRQIREGTYQVNADVIADRILYSVS